MFAVYIHLIETEIFPPIFESVERYFKRFFLRGTRGIATNSKSDIRNGIGNRFSFENELGWIFHIAVIVDENRIEMSRANRYINFR